MARRAEAFRAALSGSRWRIEALGAYFGYVRHPFAGESAVAVAERLASEFGIVTVPGSYFGSGQEAFLRMAFANADAATIALLGSRLPK
jgi:aspartate/methionine/tyrosine aminotransferase